MTTKKRSTRRSKTRDPTLLFKEARRSVVRLLKKWQSDTKKSFGEMHPESHASTHELIALNQLDMFTIDSQQGRVLRGNVPLDLKLYHKLTPQFWQYIEDVGENYKEGKTKKEAQKVLEAAYRKRGGQFRRGIVEKERAYLMGIIPRSLAKPLTDWLNQQNHLFAFYTRHPTTKKAANVVNDWAYGRVGVTYSIPQNPQMSVSPYPAYPLSRKSAAPLCDVQSPSFHINEHVKQTPTYQERRRIDRHYVMFEAIDGRYGHLVTRKDGLFKRVIQGLKLVQKYHNT